MVKQADKKCYLDLLDKLEVIDMQINRIKNQLTELRGIICPRIEKPTEEKRENND
jgi:hypothetical protein